MVTDSGTRADENPLGSPWETVAGVNGGIQLGSNAFRGQSNSGNAVNISTYLAAVAAFNANQSSQVTLTALGAFDIPGLAVRTNAATGNGYIAVWHQNINEVHVYKMASSVLGTAVQTFSATFVVSDTFRLEAVTSGANCDIKVYQNGVQIGTTYSDTSSPYASGQPGMVYIRGNSNVTVMDDWVGTGDGAPAPSIADVDEDNTITLSQTTVEIDGTDFDTATVEIRQGGFVYTPSIDSQTATTIVFDMAAIGAPGPVNAPHAGAATLAVVNGDAQEDTQAITISDDAGTETYAVGTPNADPGLRLTATPDYEAGDYVRVSNVVGGSISDVTINSDLTWDADEAVTSFDHQCWDADDGTWGDRQTQALVDDATPATGANIFIPLVLARHLKGLKHMNYATLLAAAATEAATNKAWARHNYFGILLVKPRLVPGF